MQQKRRSSQIPQITGEVAHQNGEKAKPQTKVKRSKTRTGVSQQPTTNKIQNQNQEKGEETERVASPAIKKGICLEIARIKQTRNKNATIAKSKGT
jgi:hypothetical protein